MLEDCTWVFTCRLVIDWVGPAYVYYIQEYLMKLHGKLHCTALIRTVQKILILYSLIASQGCVWYAGIELPQGFTCTLVEAHNYLFHYRIAAGIQRTTVPRTYRLRVWKWNGIRGVQRGNHDWLWLFKIWLIVMTFIFKSKLEIWTWPGYKPLSSERQTQSTHFRLTYCDSFAVVFSSVF